MAKASSNVCAAKVEVLFSIGWTSLYPELLLSAEFLGTTEIVESLLLLSSCTKHHTELLLPGGQREPAAIVSMN